MTASRPDAAAILRLGAWLLLVILAFAQAYALVHEGGHALAAVAVGGTVRTLDARAWSPRPHASYDLPGASDGQRAFVTAAGAGLPLVVWAVAMAALPRALPPALALVRFFVSVGLLAGFLPWIVLPWQALHARAPRDDVVRFAQTSGWPPISIAGLAVALMLAGFALLWWRTGGIAQLRTFRQMKSMPVPPRTLVVTAAALVGSVALALGLVAAYPVRDAGAQGGGVVLPTHDPIAEVTLDGAPFDGAFGDGVVGAEPLLLLLGFEDVAGGPFRIVLTDATGAEHGLASFGPDTTMGVASSRPRLELPAGPWSLRLIANDTAGRFRVWIDAAEDAPGP
jgi:hypothetical protein